ncbi:ATP-binding protein [Nocardioides marinquilinus]|uniref:ATP-binding protein n=1 Tax=Nocardioides marinquilinus TaxID=1210400 RepID=A0ABP9PGJ7_9ACTN
MDDWAAWPAACLEREVLRRRTGASSEAADDAVTAAADELEKARYDAGPLARIADAAGLDETEVQVLALCAAVDLDVRLQGLVVALGRVQAPTLLDVQLLTELLGADAARAVSADGRLDRAALLDVEREGPLATARVSLPRRTAWALLGDLALDPALDPACSYLPAHGDDPGQSPLTLVHGADPLRRHQTASAVTIGEAFVASPAPVDDAGWRALVRQATVVGAGLVLDLEGPPTALDRRWVERADHLPIALCSVQPLPISQAPQRPFVQVAATPADVTDDEWAEAFPGAPVPGRRPTADQLRQAVLARQEGDTPEEAVRRVATGALLAHATRVVPRVGWDDLMLPPSQERQLHALVDRYGQRDRVHREWRMPLYPSPGVVALFTGPSGTGKTTSAEVIAGELGIELYRIDLSALVSKYIGETEKNLEEVFSAAHTGNYLLLFDEADSLFGSRSKVEDSKDRYANLEVSYLLQRLETYDGFTVLTSNFNGNIDPAFMRRIHVTVHFPVPNATERERILDRALAGVPRRDLDLGMVAERFDLTGGSLRNVALTAAFAAAAPGGSGAVGMPELLRAVSSEMVKLGRRAHRDAFGRWADDVLPPGQ